MKWKSAATAFAATLSVSLAIQPGAAPARPAQLRDLEFGDINFLHTTDTHGWHAGHLLESSFSADWGDYISFAHHLRTKLESEGKDLLLIDTGDRIEGNGLYDSSDPRGKYTFPIFKQQSVDLLCSGNHELYKNSSSEDDFLKLVPAYKDNYLASNLLIRDSDTGTPRPLASTHRKFTTKNGLRIMSFGFIFDFDRNDKNTIVLPVEEVINYDWFRDAVSQNDIDLFIVIGHVAIHQQKEFGIIHDAIRKSRPNTPIQFFGGHYHIRDYRVFDKKSHGLASGRFMETIGFQSISNVKSDNITFFRRYIDNNLFNLRYHSNTTESTFTIDKGRETTELITRSRSTLKLDNTFGCAPQDYWMSRSPYPSKDSVYSLITEQVLPSIINPKRKDKTRVVMTNTGSIRFDIFEGPFTRDSIYIISPFTSNLSYIANVPYRLAKQIGPRINSGNDTVLEHLRIITFNTKSKSDLDQLLPPEQLARRCRKDLHNAFRTSQVPSESLPEVTTSSKDSPYPILPGYTTKDDLGTDGDDTIHSEIPNYNIPKIIQAIIHSPNSSEDDDDKDNEEVDLIFNQFATPTVLYYLNLLSHIDKHGDSPRSLHYYEPYAIGNAWQAAESFPLMEYISDQSAYGRPLHEITKQNPCQTFPSSYKNRDDALPQLSPPSSTRPIPRPRYCLPPCVKRGDCEDLRAPQEFQEYAESLSRLPPWEYTPEKQRAEDEKYKDKARSWIESDVQNYMPGETFTSLLATWVKLNWGANCKDHHYGAAESSRSDSHSDAQKEGVVGDGEL